MMRTINASQGIYHFIHCLLCERASTTLRCSLHNHGTNHPNTWFFAMPNMCWPTLLNSPFRYIENFCCQFSVWFVLPSRTLFQTRWRNTFSIRTMFWNSTGYIRFIELSLTSHIVQFFLAENNIRQGKYSIKMNFYFSLFNLNMLYFILIANYSSS